MTIFRIMFLLLTVVTACLQSRSAHAQTTTEAVGILSLPDATVNRKYVVALPIASAFGKVTSNFVGDAPPGLELDGSILNGTPMKAGAFKFSVKVEDQLKQVAAADFVLEVRPEPMKLDVDAVALMLPPTTVLQPYDQPLVAEGGYPPYAWKWIEGKLPEGIQLDEKTGHVKGTVRMFKTSPVQTTFRVQISDQAEQSITPQFHLDVRPNPDLVLQLVPSENVILLAQVNQPFRYVVAHCGGVGSLRWEMKGELPRWMSFKEGTIEGTPTEIGKPTTITVTLSDEAKQIAVNTLTINVAYANPPDLAWTTMELPTARIGREYVSVLRVKGGAAPYAFSVVGGILPTWAKLTPDTIEGRPSNLQDIKTSNFTIRVRDAAGERRDLPARLQVIANEEFPPPAIMTKSPLEFTVGQPISISIRAKGGLQPLHFITTEAKGVFTVDSDGILMGTATAPGISQVKVQAVDDLSQASALATLEIRAVEVSSLPHFPTPTERGRPGAPLIWQIMTGALAAAVLAMAYWSRANFWILLDRAQRLWRKRM